MHLERVFWVAALVGAACGIKTDPVRGSPSGDEACDPAAEVSYASHTRPIFATHCLRCHSTSLSAGERSGAHPLVNFDTHEGASGDIAPSRSVPLATREVLEAGLMPPDGATMLTDEELACVYAWIDQGTPP